jgi:manganese oxidase
VLLFLRRVAIRFAAVGVLLAVFGMASAARAATGVGQPGYYTFYSHELEPGTDPAEPKTSIGVNVATGNVLFSSADTPGDPAFVRYYNSLAPGTADASGLPPRWSLSAGAAVSIERAFASGDVTLMGPSGYTATLTPQVDGTWAGPPGFHGTLRRVDVGGTSWLQLDFEDDPRWQWYRFPDVPGSVQPVASMLPNSETFPEQHEASYQTLAGESRMNILWGRPAPHVIELEYDAQARLTEVTGPTGSGGRGFYDRDAATGRLVATRMSGGRDMSYGYDANGFLDRIALADGTTVELVNDAGGRALRMTLTRTGGSGPKTTTFTYGAGTTTVDDGAEATRYTYDADGRVTSTESIPTTSACPPSAPTRTVAVSLINIPLFLNRFADVVPEGRMYVLDENIEEARETFTRAADPGDPKDIIEPLVLRANKGDCVDIKFTNRLHEPPPNFNRDESIFLLPGEKLSPAGTVTPEPREFAPARTKPDEFDPAEAPRASMHFTGLTYNVKLSDGTAAGNNPDSTVAPGGSRLYRLHADREGEFMFQDGADLSSHVNDTGKAIGSNAFGAFGAIMVEPPDTTWVDVNTNQPLKSGTRAIIKDPNGPDFREHALFMHDEVEAEPGILTRFCIPPKDPAPPNGSACVNPTGAELAKLQEGTLPALGGGDADALVNGEIPVKLEWFAFNYRSEPGFNREEVGCPALDAPFRAPECVGEETSLSSWPFGDPGGGDLLFRNYRGEPMQIRLIHAAENETHTFHWHIHRWPFDSLDEGGLAEISKPSHQTEVTNPLDVQAVSPGAHYSLIPEGGAGSAHDAHHHGGAGGQDHHHSKPATFGDVIFHCHLYPHFAHGMWGLNRVHDVRERGDRTNPDGTPIENLVPLEDFDHDGDPAKNGNTTPPPDPTTEEPGFPKFVPGVFGRKAPKPPLGVPEREAGGEFPPTDAEKAAAEPDAKKPGAFFIDPCPDDVPLKRFEVAAIELEAEYNNDLEWTNPHHRMYVLEKDKDAILAGTKKPEPFSPLLNVGDCVEYKLTNELPLEFGGTVFDRAQETNEVSIHQHMVQFDVLSSDGAANGWNYDQGADAKGVLGRPAGQTITFRDYVSSDVRTNAFHDHFFPNVHQDSGLFGGSTIHPPGCTFHDPKTGDPVEVGTLVDIRCAQTTDQRGNPTTGEDYRNVSLFVEDHVPMFQPPKANDPNDDQFATPFGVPIFPSKFPSSPDDNGVMGINYRLEPFEARRNSDPANLFSSFVHGDPFTPVLRAFAGDDVKFRLFQLSMEESHAMNLHRWPWPFERDEDPGESNVIQSQHVGMLEYFDLHLGKIDLAREDPNPQNLELRDYLYHLGGADDAFLGAWGIFRVAGCNPNDLQIYKNTGLPPLQPLPDNQIAACTMDSKLPVRTAGNVCPTDGSGGITAPIKRFTVVAINKDIVYNNAGEHDPNGLMYVLEEDLTAVRNGTKPAEPLVLRVNVGDCVEVTLKNRLDPAKMKPHCFEALEPGQLGFEDPAPGKLELPGCLDEPPRNEVNVPGFKPFPVSARVGLHPGLVKYHIGSDGARVGYNFDSTVGPGGSIQYRWYAHRQGTAILEDRADVQNHPHHGLYGVLVVEPRGSRYLDPSDGTDIKSGEQAVIEDPNGPDFRENVVLMNSDMSLFEANGFPVEDDRDLRPENGDEANDPEDQGEFSVNYRNEPWVHRLLRDSAVSNVFSSPIHGDPATPLFRAYEGDPVRFRVAQAQGDPRSTGFALHGHTWKRSPNDPESQIAAFQGQFNPAQLFDVHVDKAGGNRPFAGDYLYRSNTLLRHLPGGQWGLFRVHDTPQPGTIPLPDRGN